MDLMNAIVAILRGKQNVSGDPAKYPLEAQGNGYKAYAREAQAMGEQPIPYEQWVRQATPIAQAGP